MKFGSAAAPGGGTMPVKTPLAHEVEALGEALPTLSRC